MTAVLGKREDEPGICGVCARRAGSFGVAEPRHPRSVQKFRALWVCNNPDCLQLAKKVMSMPMKDLDSFEKGIMVGALDGSSEAITIAILTELFEMNIKNIEDIDGDKITAIAKRMTQSDGMKDALSDFLMKWSYEAKRQLELGAPF